LIKVFCVVLVGIFILLFLPSIKAEGESLAICEDNCWENYNVVYDAAFRGCFDNEWHCKWAILDNNDCGSTTEIYEWGGPCGPQLAECSADMDKCLQPVKDDLVNCMDNCGSQWSDILSGKIHRRDENYVYVMGVDGTADVQLEDGSWIEVYEGDLLPKGATLYAGSGSTVVIDVEGKTLVIDSSEGVKLEFGVEGGLVSDEPETSLSPEVEEEDTPKYARVKYIDGIAGYDTPASPVSKEGVLEVGDVLELDKGGTISTKYADKVVLEIKGEEVIVGGGVEVGLDFGEGGLGLSDPWERGKKPLIPGFLNKIPTQYDLPETIAEFQFQEAIRALKTEVLKDYVWIQEISGDYDYLPEEDRVAQVQRLDGSWINVREGALIHKGDLLTVPYGMTVVVNIDHGIIALRSLDEARLVWEGEGSIGELIDEARKRGLRLDSGALRFKVLESSWETDFHISTPCYIAGVVGTDFTIAYDEETGIGSFELYEGSAEILDSETNLGRIISTDYGEEIKRIDVGEDGMKEYVAVVGGKSMWWLYAIIGLLVIVVGVVLYNQRKK